MATVAKWLGDLMENAMGSKMPLMQVNHVENISSSLKRVRFAGELKGMDFQPGYAVVMRVSDREFRHYTASFSDTQAGIIEMIFHLHGGGPGSHYADSIAVGDQLRVSMPSGQKQYDPAVKRQVIFGDETSLGLALAFLPLLRQNGHQYRFYFELDQENQQVPERLGLDQHTVYPKGETFQHAERIGNLPVFHAEEWKGANYVLTGNVQSMRNFRNVLKRHGVKGRVYSKGYWQQGKIGF